MKVADIAREAMEQADGDVAKATDILEQKARGDVGVWQALTEKLLRTACYDACRSVCRKERRQIWLSPGYDESGKGERVKGHAASLMDWPLPGGKRLRDATKADLVEAATFYSKQAAHMASVATFLEAVAGRVKTKTVGDTLSDADLQKLKDKTWLAEAA